MKRLMLAMFSLGCALVLSSCSLFSDPPSAEELWLVEQMQKAEGWPRIHAAEALIAADVSRELVAETFRAELEKEPTDVPWLVGCLRVLYQSTDKPEEKQQAREKIGAIASDAASAGATHAVETLLKLRVDLTNSEREAIRGYVQDKELRGDYAVALLAADGDADLRKEVLTRLGADNTIAAYAYYYFGGLMPEELSALWGYFADEKRPAALRAEVFRALAAYTRYNRALHSQLLQMFAAGDQGALRTLLFIAGDFHYVGDTRMLQNYWHNKSLPLSTRITAAAALLQIKAKL